jgi:hypothetical protein
LSAVTVTIEYGATPAQTLLKNLLTQSAVPDRVTTMLTEKQLFDRADKPRPPTGTPAYHLWYYARIKLGLGTEPKQKRTADRKKYNREYMRMRRSK